MNRMPTRPIVLTVMFVTALLVVAGPARAADVRIEVSSREVYVDVPFTLTISIENASTYEQPVLPPIPGVRAVGVIPPSRSSYTHIMNGRRTDTVTITLGYQLVVDREGPLVIPALTVVADGKAFRSQPISINAVRSVTGDRLAVEIKADRDVYYLGEQAELTMEIWLKPYLVPSHNARFDEQEMWQLVDLRRSSLGVFGSNDRRIPYREASRTDADGRRQRYYVYTLGASLAPDHAGNISFDDLRVVVNYPEQVVRSRRMFTRGRWEVVRAKTIVGRVEHEPVRIEPTPAEGRPDVFAGAVGQFDFSARAEPTEVAVGEPITLTLTVHDRTKDGAPLEILRPPPLDRVSALAERFKLPDDPMAGDVSGRRKAFQQTIRATSDQVQEIPAIPFAFFDPASQRYETVWSDPIPLDVSPSSSVSLSDLVGAETPRNAVATELTEVSGGLLANYSGPELLAVQGSFNPDLAHLAAMVVPPLAFVGFVVGRRRALKLQDRGVTRKRAAKRTALRRLEAVAQTLPAQQAQETLAAVCNYVGDRLNLPPGLVTRSEVIDRLRAAGASDDVVGDLSSLLAECEHSQYARPTANGEITDRMTKRAATCIGRLERERIR